MDAPGDHGPPADDEGWQLPGRDLLLEGGALVALAAGLALGAWQAGRRSILLAPFALAGFGAALLAAWGAAIALTGGVKHDDHARL